MGAVTCVASRRQHKGSITTAGMVAGIELGHMPQRECQHNGDGLRQAGLDMITVQMQGMCRFLPVLQVMWLLRP